MGPVGRGRNLEVCRELERVNHTQNLVEIPAAARDAMLMQVEQGTGGRVWGGRESCATVTVPL